MMMITDVNLAAPHLFDWAIACEMGEYADEDIRRQVKTIYDLAKLPQPAMIIVLPSPIACRNYLREQGIEKVNFSATFDTASYVLNMMTEDDKCVEPEYLEAYVNINKMTGGIFPYDDVCLCSRKPVEVRFKTGTTTIHCDNAPVVEYADGTGLYALNGVFMPEHYVMTPAEKIDVQVVMDESNAEIRRELIRKIGIERVISKLDAKIISTENDKNGNAYELLFVHFPKATIKDRKYLKMINPSIGTYHIEGVPPECSTVAEALEFRNNTTRQPDILT